MKYLNVLGKDFNTKPEAYKHFTSFRDQMINAGKLGEFNCLTEDTAVKKSRMDSLFKDYFKCDDPKWYQKKIGLGVKNWFFGRDSEGGVCLWIKQKDKPPKQHQSEFLRSVDISHWGLTVPVSAKWIFTCFGRGVHNDHPLHRVKQALRKAIKYQIKEFRDSVKNECQECGEEGYGLDFEVDHTPNLTEIANNFMKNYDEKFLIKNVSKEASEDKWYFINEKLENDWCEYHLKEATLRLLCTSCHNKKTYKRKGKKI